MKVICDVNISDYESVARTWKERLLTLPWKPWVKTKSIYAPKAYTYGDTVICSPRIFQQLSSKAYLPKDLI